MECLCVKDIDFEAKQIFVRSAKGLKDRVTILPELVIQELKQHLEKAKALHEYFTSRGFGEVELPYALDKKYPNVKYEWGGSMSFWLKMCLPILKLVPGGAITFMKVCYSGQLKR